MSNFQITPKLSVEVMEHTALVTLKNPPAHIWDLENLRGLKELVTRLNADKNIYALVIMGEGEKFFSAGADLKLFADGNKGVARDMARAFGEAFETLSDFRGVSIAAINGYAMGGGLECALACDIRIAEEHAQMALPEATVGLLPCAAGTQLLPIFVGEAWAKRMALLGERINAQTAKEIGLILEVVAKGQVKTRALELAKMAAKQSPSAVAKIKELMGRSRKNAMGQALSQEREYFLDLFDTQDQKEGVGAFLEKRTPQWKNA